jgi:Diacylglycerol kinase catalytic domain
VAVEVVLLTLGHGSDCSGTCGGGGGCEGGCAAGAADPTGGVRVPVLACRDALRAAGATVRIVEADSDRDIDQVVEETVLTGAARLVVAGNTDGEPRAVVRRLLRRCAPPPSQRPADLPAGRTVPDLPPIGLLPMDATATDDLTARLHLPRDPAAVAAAVVAGRARRLDLLRTDSGSVTLHGAMLGGADEGGRPVPWRAVVNVDDTVLTDGSDPLLACAVVNADGAGYAELDGLPLVNRPDPTDGELDVAVAVLGYVGHRWLGNRRARIEVRRARGRAVAVTPSGDVPYSDDGVTGTLGRKRTWWMEQGAWAVYG